MGAFLLVMVDRLSHNHIQHMLERAVVPIAISLLGQLDLGINHKVMGFAIAIKAGDGNAHLNHIALLVTLKESGREEGDEQVIVAGIAAHDIGIVALEIIAILGNHPHLDHLGGLQIEFLVVYGTDGLVPRSVRRHQLAEQARVVRNDERIHAQGSGGNVDRIQISIHKDTSV